MSFTEIAQISLRDRLVMNLCGFHRDGYREGWVSFRLEDPFFTDTPTIGIAFTPAKAMALANALIAAAKAAGYVEAEAV